MLDLRRRGLSLNRLAANLGLSKTTIYYHIRKNFGMTLRPMEIRVRVGQDLGEFLGIFASDGCYHVDRKRYHDKMSIHLSENQAGYAQVMGKIITEIFGKSPKITLSGRKRQVILVLHGRRIREVLDRFLYWRGNRTHTIRFRASALKLSRPFLRGVLRGLVAGDGSIYVPKRRISFGVVSKVLALQFSRLMTSFGIKTHTYAVKYSRKKTLYHVHASGLERVRKFKSKVGMTDPRRLAQLDEILNQANQRFFP